MQGGGTPLDFARLCSLWEQVGIEFRQRHPELQSFLKDVTLCESGPGQVVIRFSSRFLLKQMGQKRRLGLLEECLAAVTGEPWKLAADLDTTIPAQESPAASPTAPPVDPRGPALRDDPTVKKVRELFRGKFV